MEKKALLCFSYTDEKAEVNATGCHFQIIPPFNPRTALRLLVIKLPGGKQ